MQLKLRRDGQKLTSDDLDGNFMELQREIEDAKRKLEEIEQELAKLHAGRASSSSEISVKISDSNGLEVHVPGLRVQGSFNEGEQYRPGDFVYHDNAFWFAVKENFAEWNIHNWKRIFQFPKDEEGSNSSASAAAAKNEINSDD